MFRKEDSIDLSGIALDVLTNSRDGWMSFFASKSNGYSVSELDMHNSRFNLINTDELASLLEAIRVSGFVKLDISENLFFLTFNEQKLKLLFAQIFESEVKILNLSQTGIVSAGRNVLIFIAEHISLSKLVELNLSKNSIQNMPLDELYILFAAIKNGNIHHIDLSGNNFKYLDEDQFGVISEHLRGSMVTSVNLDNCSLNPAYKTMLLNILRDNSANSTLHQNYEQALESKSEGKKTEDDAMKTPNIYKRNPGSNASLILDLEPTKASEHEPETDENSISVVPSPSFAKKNVLRR